MELKAMAEAQREWVFTGVDPSAAMLDLARRNIEPFNDRIELIEGTVDAAPSGSFDGAACLLTLHFLDKSERLLTLKDIHRRLKPDARLVVAHHSVPSGSAERWLARSVAFADRTSVDWEKAKATAVGMARLPLLSVAEEEALLCEAGFSDVELFYAAFSFRGLGGDGKLGLSASSRVARMSAARCGDHGRGESPGYRSAHPGYACFGPELYRARLTCQTSLQVLQQSPAKRAC